MFDYKWKETDAVVCLKSKPRRSNTLTSITLIIIITVLVPVKCGDCKTYPVLAINAVIISYFCVSVREIYSHTYGLRGTVMFSPKYLGCHFGVHVLVYILEKFCSFTIWCIVAFY